MSDFYRKINEGEIPRTTAEIEFAKHLGEDGLRLFNQHFPPEKVLTEMEKAAEWEEWLAENGLQAEAELAMAETSAKAKEQIKYLGGAINYLEEFRKARKIPDRAKFFHIFIYLGDEAQKLLGTQTVILNPNSFGVLAALKAFVDLKREEFPEDTDLIDIIKELNDRLDNLQKTTNTKGDK